MNTNVAIGPTFAHAWRNFLAHRGLVALSVVALGIAAVLRISVLQLAISSYAQFELTYQSLADDDLTAAGYGKRRFFAVLGVQILVAIAVIVGFMLLVLPGIYLYLRFYIAVPALIAEEAGVVEAIRISWRRTARQEIALLALVVLMFLPAALLWVVFFACVAATSGGMAVVVSALLALLATALTIVFGWFLAAAAYAATRGEASRLEEVFA